jgi:hypothetical protein
MYSRLSSRCGKLENEGERGSHLQNRISSARNRYHSPIETEGGGHRGSVVGEGDAIV